MNSPHPKPRSPSPNSAPLITHAACHCAYLPDGNIIFSVKRDSSCPSEAQGGLSSALRRQTSTWHRPALALLEFGPSSTCHSRDEGREATVSWSCQEGCQARSPESPTDPHGHQLDLREDFTQPGGQSYSFELCARSILDTWLGVWLHGGTLTQHACVRL